MSRIALVLVAALCVLALCGPAAAESDQALTVISCPQIGISALCDVDCGTDYNSTDGFYVFTSSYGYIPYILIGRIFDTESDWNAVIRDDLTPSVKEGFGAQFKGYTEYEYFATGGKQLPAAEYMYDNNGTTYYILRVFDTLEDETIMYTARYSGSSRDSTLATLDCIVRTLKPDADYYSGANSPQPTAIPAPTAEPLVTPQPDASAQSILIQRNDIVDQGSIFGRCAAPAGYEEDWYSQTCGSTQSYSNPVLVGVFADSGDGTVMTYLSMRDYAALVYEDTPDGEYNSAFHTPMLHYMTAAEFCDYTVQLQLSPAGASNITLVDEETFPALQPVLRQLQQAELKERTAELKGSLFSVDWVEYSISLRRYSFDYEGGKYFFVAFTAVCGDQFSSSYMGLKPSPGGGIEYGEIKQAYVAWDTEFMYTMSCPAERWEDDIAAFEVFVCNTGVSDEFKAANKRMADALWELVAGKPTLESGRNYAEREIHNATDDGDSYNEDRFTDYIFDQNDYTLSDGSHVKVSTAYDYVYEGDNGTVYATQSAFGQPGGSVQLYPNR